MQSEYPLLITLGALLILNPLIRGLSNRIGVPALVGYIILGFLIKVLSQHWSFVTPVFENTISVLAQLGIVALLFRVGLKSHIRALLAKLPDASIIWIGDVLTNLLFGFAVSRYVLALSLETSLVIATAFSATSVAVSVSVWDEMSRLNTAIGQLLVDVAELDDLSGVLLLAILLVIIPLLQDHQGIALFTLGSTVLAVLVKLALFITGCYLFSHFLEPGFTRFNLRWTNSKTGLTITVLGAGLVIAAVAGYLGFSLAIGALLAGLAFSRDPQAVHTDAKFIYFLEFFSPFFFIYIGMQVSPDAIIPSLGLAIILFIPAVFGKFLGVAGPALRIVKRPDAILLGLSMIPRAEIAMVIVFQCRQLSADIIPDDVYAAITLVSVMTSIFAPVILRWQFSKRDKHVQ